MLVGWASWDWHLIFPVLKRMAVVWCYFIGLQGEVRLYRAKYNLHIILNSKKFRFSPKILWISPQVFKGKILLPSFMESRYYYSLSQIPPILGRGYYSHVCERLPIININNVVHIRGNSHHFWFFYSLNMSISKKNKTEGLKWNERK